MKIWVFVIGTLLLVYNQPQNTAYEKVTRLARPFPENTEVAIGIIDHGKKSYIGFTKTKGRLVLTNNGNKVFGIASITKLFTSALIADMAEKKKIGLFDDIDKYYPFDIRYSGDAKAVTIVGLCTHTSGLPADGGNVEAYLKNGVRINHGGGKYQYSNFGFMVLGDILERVSKKDYTTLLTERILKPLNMQSTSIDLMNIDEDQFVAGRNASGNETAVKVRYAYEGVGSIKSSAEDMLRFLDYQFNRRSVLMNSFRITQKIYYKKSGTESMGLGWKITHKNKETIYHHNGLLSGYTSEIMYALKKKRGVIVLSNLSGQGAYAGNIEKIAEACLEL